MMKRQQLRVQILLLLSAVLGAGQLCAQNPVVTEVRKEWERARQQFFTVAEAMPESKYEYRPSPKVRSFREILIHVLGENMNWMETVGGVSQPSSLDRYEGLKTRAEFLKALSEYLDYGTQVMNSMTDQKLLENVPFRNGQSLRLAVVLQTIGHTYRNFGHLDTYVRSNGVVPRSRE
jgi:uncharacterized damage-inducible protein DinB